MLVRTSLVCAAVLLGACVAPDSESPGSQSGAVAQAPVSSNDGTHPEPSVTTPCTLAFDVPAHRNGSVLWDGMDYSRFSLYSYVEKDTVSGAVPPAGPVDGSSMKPTDAHDGLHVTGTAVAPFAQAGAKVAVRTGSLEAGTGIAFTLRGEGLVGVTLAGTDATTSCTCDGWQTACRYDHAAVVRVSDVPTRFYACWSEPCDAIGTRIELGPAPWSAKAGYRPVDPSAILGIELGAPYFSPGGTWDFYVGEIELLGVPGAAR
jgi:hypothetical protein